MSNASSLARGRKQSRSYVHIAACALSARRRICFDPHRAESDASPVALTLCFAIVHPELGRARTISERRTILFDPAT